MQFIFHPATRSTCSVLQAFDACPRTARYDIDQSQVDLAATIIEVGSIEGMWVPSTDNMAVCLHHASKIIQHDHATFRVVRAGLIPAF